ncbi:MAG: response regulator [Anaerovoracaceae bacterium]
MNQTQPVEIASGIYWVGGISSNQGLQCNPYLLVDGTEAVLIDPGSILDFEAVWKNVCSLISPDRIRYVILHHQDPDLASSVPLFEKKGCRFELVTHWRTKTLVRYYGVVSDFYIINSHGNQLTLASGRTLSFLPAPYLHFPGAVMTYDARTQTLFSGDLFGAFSGEWALEASEDYMERMKSFHEHYMPSREVLQPVMESLLALPISLIAPQHGSLIRKDIRSHIKALRDLECGSFLHSIRKNLGSDKGYLIAGEAILKRYASLYGQADLRAILEELGLETDSDLPILSARDMGYQMWVHMAERMFVRKGEEWLIIAEPLVERLTREYDIPLPEIYATHLARSNSEIHRLTAENKTLTAAREQRNENLAGVEQTMTHSAVTGLYNFSFFRNYLRKAISEITAKAYETNPALIVLSLDQTERIKYRYGDKEVDEMFRNTALLLEGFRDEYQVYFKLPGSLFAGYIPHTAKERAVETAEEIRNAIASSQLFVEPVTASLGVVSLRELPPADLHSKNPSERFYEIALERVRLAKNNGKNRVSGSSDPDSVVSRCDILLVEPEDTSAEVIGTVLENMHYHVQRAVDGKEAQAMAEQCLPTLILSEVMLPKLDGFALRQRLLMRSETKNIPMLYMSHLKTEDSVRRAADLGVIHYLKKPLMLAEIQGIIRNLTDRGEES